ncbi:MAG: AarF/UbiB family protein [Chloracidobacterium sp.]|uniref:AarF/ABC1/UbiB kinase family protein n=1 Tax=Chloracidobacterium validum TaxID=2821543 RepID=A0ABX8BCQ6_9BACT|nr:AarF/UbiB family protein [Chloracidobacterium validum]QUW03433.1 AarF/ABC1/UbiB kinase family protein [Chloracidobacterium validum]
MSHRPSSRFASLVQQVHLARRATAMLRLALPTTLAFVRDQRRYLAFGAPRHVSEQIHRQRAQTIKQHIETLGTAFIKLGQLVSTRPDLVPAVYIEEIAKLQDGITPLPGREARRTLEAIYGTRLEAVFDRFDDQALAAASLAQVHYAVWQGQDVAVKFVRPDIPAQMAIDLKIAGFVMRQLDQRFSNSLTRMLSTAIAEGSKGMAQELDLTNEMENLETLARVLARREDVTVPLIYPEVSGSQVIVMEYCPGVKFTDVERLRAAGFDFDDLIARLVKLYAEMIFVAGVYHADPHPGNILVGDGGQLILLDYGMVCRLSRETRAIILDSVVAGLRGDRERLVDGLYETGIVSEGTNRRRIHAFIEEIIQLHQRGLNAQSRMLGVGLAIERTARELGLNLPPELVYVFRSLSLLEGMASKLRPGWSLIEHGFEPMQEALAPQYVKSLLNREGLLNTAVDEIRRFLGHRTVRRFT